MPIFRSIIAAAVLCGVATLRAGAQSAPSAAERVLAAALIPGLAVDARAAGVAEKEIGTLLDVFRTKSVPAGEAKVILDEEVRGVRAHGPVDNFGSFVQARLAEGLRGQQLAAAIRAEHAARGKGRPGRKDAAATPASAKDQQGKQQNPKGGAKLRKPGAPDSAREFRTKDSQRPIP